MGRQGCDALNDHRRSKEPGGTFMSLDPLPRQKTWEPLDLVHFPAQNPFGPDYPRTTFSMRLGVVNTYRHREEANLVLASRLISIVLEEPDAIFRDWKDLSRQGFPGNLLYTRRFYSPSTVVGDIAVPVPRDGDVLGVIADKEQEIVDYDWFERSGDQRGFPMGHGDPDVIGELLWARN